MSTTGRHPRRPPLPALPASAGLFVASVLCQSAHTRPIAPADEPAGPVLAPFTSPAGPIPPPLAQLQVFRTTDAQTLESLALSGNLPAVTSMLESGGSAASDENKRRALFVATLACQEGVAALLRQRGAPVDVFINAVAGETGEVRRRIESDPALLNAHDPLIQRSLLCWAIAARRNDVAVMLIDRGAAVNDRASRPYAIEPLLRSAETDGEEGSGGGGREIETPLLAALRVGRRGGEGKPDAGLVLKLLEKGADANIRCTDGPPLLIAVGAGDIPLIEALVAHKADVNGKDVAGWPLLCRAIKSKPVAQRLLKLGADPNAKTPGNDTILDMAARTPETGVADELVAHGARFTFTSACILGKAEFVRDELRKNRTIVFRVVNAHLDETPLFLAARFGQPEVARLLLDAGAKMDRANRWGSLPLHVAAEQGRTSVARLLVERGMKLNADSPGGMPLHVAAANGRLEAIALFIDLGAKVDGESEQSGLTPLAASCKEDQAEAAAMLIARGADVNLRGRGARAGRQTALHAAAYSAAPSAVKLLLEKGADRNLRDGQGRTPMECARMAASYDKRAIDKREAVIRLLSEPVAK